MNEAPPPKAPSRAVDVFLAVCFLIGIGIVYTAVAEVMRSRSLGDGATAVTARVTDTRVVSYRKRGDSYEVRFAFDVAGKTYTHGDATGRDDLWEVVTEEAWNAARANGTIAVVYVGDDPGTNRAVDRANPDLQSNVIGGCTGFLCMAPAVLALIGAIRKKRARVAA